MTQGDFTLDTFAAMLKKMWRSGVLQETIKMLPATASTSDGQKNVNVKRDLSRVLGLIDAMTPAERHAPTKLIDTSRRRRIAAGAGLASRDVATLLRQFGALAAMMCELRR